MEKSAEEIIRTEFRNKLREDIGDGIDDIPISDLGIDSLDFFEILINLEDEFNIIIQQGIQSKSLFGITRLNSKYIFLFNFFNFISNPVISRQNRIGTIV